VVVYSGLTVLKIYTKRYFIRNIEEITFAIQSKELNSCQALSFGSLLHSTPQEGKPRGTNRKNMQMNSHPQMT